MHTTGRKFHKPKKGQSLTREQVIDNEMRLINAAEMIEEIVYPPTTLPYKVYYILGGKRRLLGYQPTLESATMVVEFLDIEFQNRQDDLLDIPRFHGSAARVPVSA